METEENQRVNQTTEQSADSQEQEIYYDRRERQRIPILVPKGGKRFKIYHQLKPLSDERYFQFETAIDEKMWNQGDGLYQSQKINEIYKPHYDLYRELLIEREAAKETDSDALFQEAVQVIKALLYYQKFEPAEADPSELYDSQADESVYFGAAYSGAWLGLVLNYKSGFGSQTDAYLSLSARQRRWIGGRLSFDGRQRSKRIYEYALPFLKSAEGYAKTENLADAVPAWHINQTTDELFSRTAQLLGNSPVIDSVYSQ